MAELEGKVAVITGGASGLGLARKVEFVGQGEIKEQDVCVAPGELGEQPFGTGG